MQRNELIGVPLERKEIRLQYSGYVIFAARLISVATGLVFQFMLGRAIAADSPEYAIWGNINTVLPYFTLLAGVVPFWVMRCVARGKEGATKTGLIVNLIFSLITTGAYLVIIPLILPSLLSEAGVANPAVYLPFYLIVSVQIIEMYLIGLFEPCLQARTPQSVGFGLILQQVVRVILGYVIIIQLGQPLMGAVASTIIAFSVQAVYYFKLFANELKQRMQWGYIKEWLKGSVLIVYSVVGGVIASFVFIMLFYYGGYGGMDIYYAALQIANVIVYSGFLSFALYPKLLTERRSEDVTASMKTVLMFALPMMVGVVSLSSSYIVLIRPGTVMYPGAEWVLVVLALDAFVSVVAGIYGAVLSGVETVDHERLSFKSMGRSKLFRYYSLSYVHSAITIPITYYILTTYAFQQPTIAAFSVCLINSVVRFAMFLILVIMVRGMFKIAIPWRSIAKYSLASAVMGIVLFLLPYTDRILTTLAWTAVGGIVYLAVLMAIDKESRSLPKTILKEIKGKSSTV
jgi:O-antigen/teichoic acid export membrane protein